MLSVLSCIAFEHDPLFVFLAISVLVFGSILTMRLYARVRRSQGQLKYLWLVLAGVIAGGTIWSTHFVSMLAYESELILGYRFGLTALSLFIAVFGTTTGLFLASFTQRSILIEIGGAVFGASIAAMHFTGIEAMVVSGIVQFSPAFVVLSILCACVFGVLSTNRIARPVTMYCKYGASLSFILAVAGLHFIAMAGLEVFPLQIDPDANGLISDKAVGVGVGITMLVLMLVAMISYSIDLEATRVTNQKIDILTLHDPVTGLRNRKGAEMHLDNLIQSVSRDNSRVAVVSCSLSQFDKLQNVKGHGAADALLRRLATQLSKCLEGAETIAHFGSGHFVFTSERVYHNGYVEDFCLRVKDAIAQSVANDVESELSSDSFVGYALYPDHATDVTELMDKSKFALRLAIQKRTTAPFRYDSSEDDHQKKRNALTIDLRRALKNNEFELYYQPQNDVLTGEITGAEALLRWKHPVNGMISPFVFIPLAEETGMIGELGKWVIHEACREAASWGKPIKVAVNVSPVQLSAADFPVTVADALRMSKLDPARLDLEITETGLISDTSHALQILDRLKDLGVGIAMDDFGTGYSSLATLQAFPFDKIKIDREFVKDLDRSEQSKAIVTATCVLAKSLKIPVLAEGVETNEHLCLLGELGVAEVQGYFFGKPVPASEFKSCWCSADGGSTQGAGVARKPSQAA